jgi:hypothetical protein
MDEVGGTSERNTDADAVVARFRWTLEELRDAYRNQFLYFTDRRTRYTLNVMCSAALVVCILVVAKQWAHSDAHVVLGMIGILGLLSWFGRRFTVRLYSTRRQFRRCPEQNADFEWQFGPDDIRVHWKLAESRVSWSLFIKAASTPKGILLYLSSNLWYWIPRHAFASDEDFNQVVRWAEQHVHVRRTD